MESRSASSCSIDGTAHEPLAQTHFDEEQVALRKLSQPSKMHVSPVSDEQILILDAEIANQPTAVTKGSIEH